MPNRLDLAVRLCLHQEQDCSSSIQFDLTGFVGPVLSISVQFGSRLHYEITQSVSIQSTSSVSGLLGFVLGSPPHLKKTSLSILVLVGVRGKLGVKLICHSPFLSHYVPLIVDLSAAVDL